MLILRKMLNLRKNEKYYNFVEFYEKNIKF